MVPLTPVGGGEGLHLSGKEEQCLQVSRRRGSKFPNWKSMECTASTSTDLRREASQGWLRYWWIKLIQVSFIFVNTLFSLINFVFSGKPTLLTGDLNICLMKKPNNLLSKWLLEMGFSQLVTSSTHDQGGLIDHVYWLDTELKWKSPEFEKYSPYYSDHDCLLITLYRS